MRDEPRDRAYEAEQQAERERRGRAPTATCRTCAGGDLPGWIDQSDPDTQGIHDQFPCPDCNPNHPLHSRISMNSVGQSKLVTPDAVPMPADFRKAMGR